MQKSKLTAKPILTAMLVASFALTVAQSQANISLWSSTNPTVQELGQSRVLIAVTLYDDDPVGFPNDVITGVNLQQNTSGTVLMSTVGDPTDSPLTAAILYPVGYTYPTMGQPIAPSWTGPPPPTMPLAVPTIFVFFVACSVPPADTIPPGDYPTDPDKGTTTFTVNVSWVSANNVFYPQTTTVNPTITIRDLPVPVPDPASMSLALLGLGSLAMLRLRRGKTDCQHFRKRRMKMLFVRLFVIGRKRLFKENALTTLTLVIVMMCFSSSILANTASLALVNPGFETGDFTGWTTFNYVPQWGGGSGPYISNQYPWNPDNMYYASTWTGAIQTDTSGGSGFYQSGITMPNADDVRWSFWIRPSLTLYSGHMSIGGFVSIEDNMGDKIVWNIYEDYYSGDFHLHFQDTIPDLWTMVPTISDGYMVTTNNLKDSFPDAQTLKVTFYGYQTAAWGELSTAELEVDDRAPVPAPSALLLGVSGLAGVIGLVRKRILK
ncbi:MAG: PEP-CTERM sorting domain-containing protein [Sedimentisphaerales bacterium]